MTAKRLTDQALGAAMRKARKAGGYVLKDMKARLGYSIGTISDWETVEDGPEPARGMKVVHYFAELLRDDKTRDALLQELGVLDGGIEAESIELRRRLDFVRRAYRSDNPTIRSIIQSLEVALMEESSPDAVERRGA